MPDTPALSIAFSVDLTLPYAEAVDAVTAALKTEGFGVITRIDVQATLKEKLNVDFRPYVILGACNPPLAYRALATEAQVGALLPCNVTVEATEAGSRVTFVNPQMMVAVPPLGDNPAMHAVAAEASDRFQRVAAALRQ